MYSKEFQELDLLLDAQYKRSCFALQFAEINKMCKGNYSTAIVLARLLYWWRANDSGEHRGSAKLSDGSHAVAKSAMEMAIETGMSENSAQRAYDNLVKLGIISIPEPKKLFSGHPTQHIVLNEQVFTELFWKYYIQIQLDLAKHKLKLISKDRIEEVQQLKERIAMLKDPAFDPRTDFPTPTPSKQSNKLVKFPRKEIDKAIAESASSTEAESIILRGKTMEEFLAEKKNTPANATNIDKSTSDKPPKEPPKRKKVVYNTSF